MNMEASERSSCECGCHIYKGIWDAVIGKELQCEGQSDANRSNQFAVTIKRWDNRRSSAT